MLLEGYADRVVLKISYDVKMSKKQCSTINVIVDLLDASKCNQQFFGTIQVFFHAG